MEFCVLFFDLFFASYFTYLAINDFSEDMRRMCKIFSFVWWLVVFVEVMQIIIY